MILDLVLTLNSIVFLNMVLFLFGLFGVLFSVRNMLRILVGFEVMLLSVNLNFIISSVFFDEIVGQVYGLLVLTIAAGEVAIGLAFVVIFFRNSGVISTDFLKDLKG